MSSPRPSPRSTTVRGTRYILITISLVALAVALWRISDVVVVAFGGVVGAALIRGLAVPLGRRTGLSDHWSVTVTLLSLTALVGILGWFFGNQVANEASEMQRMIPEATKQLRTSLEGSWVGQELINAMKLMSSDTKTISGVGSAAGATLMGIADTLLVFFLSIYFAYSPGEYLAGIVRLLPPIHRKRVTAALLDAGEALRRWLLAQFLAMLIVAALVSASLAILHVPLALLLGAIAGILEFIPSVGPILFTIPGVLMGFTQGPTMAFHVLLLYIVVQQVESNVIIPLLQRWSVRLPPAITLLSVVVGAILLGPAGIVFATPMAVVGMALVKHLYVEAALEHVRPEAATGRSLPGSSSD